MKTKQIENAIKVNGEAIVIEALKRFHQERQEKLAGLGDEIGARYSHSFLLLLEQFERAVPKINGRLKKQTWDVIEFREHFDTVQEVKR